MPRIVCQLALTLVLVLTATLPAAAQSALPPHSWLFGSWTGGIFPPPSSLNAQECLAQPVVIFTRDLAMRATLMEATYIQRLVETARVTGNGVEFRFAAAPQLASAGPFGTGSSPADSGFGCEDPDVLHVQKRGENEITFPGCPEFPYPLVRCPGR